MEAGTGVFFLSMLIVGGLAVPDRNVATVATWSTGVAAAVAAYKMESPLGRCLGIGLAAWIAAGIVMWFGGCAMATLFMATWPKISSQGQMMAELLKLVVALDLWSIIFGLLIICIGAGDA